MAPGFQARLNMARRFLKNILALGFGLLVALLLLEGFLRIYNPIPQRIKGGKIVLPANRTYRIKNTVIEKLDPVITYRRNSLGFRGEELPAGFEKYLSIIAIGGSTTECYYLSDGKTWSDQLAIKLKDEFPGIWVNNAGLDGHSTYGHQILLDDYIVKIRPKVVIFLIGNNDAGRSDLNSNLYDRILIDRYANTLDFLSKKSELANTLLNIARSIKAKRLGVAHKSIDLKSLATKEISDADIANLSDQHKPLAENFYLRVKKLVETAKANDIEPVLVTQPQLWGRGIDPTSGVDLEKVAVGENNNGKSSWQVMEIYNDATRRAAEETGSKLVDLARELPKNSQYFYDGLHFTNEGAAEVGEILANDLKDFLKKFNLNLSQK